MPGVAYQFLVYGKNSLGKGNNSQKLIIKTKGELSFFGYASWLINFFFLLFLNLSSFFF